jgi:hypothetical protein
MSPRNLILITLLTLTASKAHAAIAPLALPLNVAQNSNTQRYADYKGAACLILDAGRAMGERDAPALKKLISDLDVFAGPGVVPDTEPAGSLLYTYNLVPEIRGNTLIYRGLLSSTRGNAVRVKARGPASLVETVERDLGFGGRVDLVFTHQCDWIYK